MQPTTVSVWNLEAEQSVLGGLMLQPEEYVIDELFDKLGPEHFYRSVHSEIFAAIKSLFGKKQPTDLLTVSDELERTGRLVDLGGFSYLAEIAKNTTSVANIISYAEIVKERAARRLLIEKLNNGIELASSNDGQTAEDDLNQIVTELEFVADAIEQNSISELVHMGDIFADVVDDMQKRIDGFKFGITTGIDSLDELLAPKGLVNHALCVVGARPKMGKTSFMLKIIEHVALDLHKPVALFSMEMSKKEITEKMVTQVGNFPISALYRSDGMTDEVYTKYGNAMNLLTESKIHVSDTPALTVRSIINQAKRFKRKHGDLGLIAIDYLTLMTPEKAERNDLAYGMITKSLKNLAKELNCPVLLLTQLNRGLESRPDKRPRPSDSRDTGQIEQDCDYWIGLYRDEVYFEDTPGKGVLEIGVEMNRHGQAGRALANFHEGKVSSFNASQMYVTKEEHDEIEKKEKQQAYKDKGF